MVKVLYEPSSQEPSLASFYPPEPRPAPGPAALAPPRHRPPAPPALPHSAAAGWRPHLGPDLLGALLLQPHRRPLEGPVRARRRRRAAGTPLARTPLRRPLAGRHRLLGHHLCPARLRLPPQPLELRPASAAAGAGAPHPGQPRD